MPTIDYVQGFEHRITTEGIIITGAAEVWATVNNPSAITSVAGRLGGYAIQIAEDGVSATAVMHKVPTTQSRVFSGYFKVSAEPTVDSVILLLTDTAAGTICRFDVQAAGGGTMRAQVAGGTRQTGPAVADGSWHRLDAYIDSSATTWTVHWSIDGAAQTNATETGQVATDSQKLSFGSATAAHTATVVWDDVVTSATAADYPLGSHAVYSVLPTGDGTHVNSAGDIQDDLNVDIGTTTAWDKIDNWLPTTTPFITQHTTAPTHYAEVTFADTTETVIWGVVGTAALWASGSAANDVTMRIVSSTNATLTNIYSGDVSQTTIRYTSALIAAPGGAWTTSNFNGVKGRFGFSTAAGTDPRLSALLLEYAVPTTPPTVTVTAVTATATADARTPAPRLSITATVSTATGDAQVPAVHASVVVIAVAATALGTARVPSLVALLPVGRLGLGTSFLGNIVLGEPGREPTTAVIAVTATATAVGKVPAPGILIPGTAASANAVGQLPTFFGNLAIVQATATGDAQVAVITIVIPAETATATADAQVAAPLLGGQNNIVAGVTATATADGQVGGPTIVIAAVSATASGAALAAGVFIEQGVYLKARWMPEVKLQARYNDTVYLKGRAVVGIKSPVTANHEVYIDSDKDIFWNVWNRDLSSYEDIGGWTLGFKLATTQGGTAILTKTVSVEDSTTGLVKIDLDPSDTSTFAPDTYFYTLARTNSGHEDPVADGKFVLKARVA